MLNAKEGVRRKWESFYHDTISKCQESGLKVCCWGALLGNAITGLSQNQAAQLAWSFQHAEGFHVGDAYPLVAISPDGRTARVYKVDKDLALVSRRFGWDGQAWVLQDEHDR